MKKIGRCFWVPWLMCKTLVPPPISPHPQLENRMNRKNYLVTVSGKIAIDTTVAVMAESKSEATHIALDGVRCNTEEWLRYESLIDDPIVTDVSEETWDEVQYADQKHLVGPQLH